MAIKYKSAEELRNIFDQAATGMIVHLNGDVSEPWEEMVVMTGERLEEYVSAKVLEALERIEFGSGGPTASLAHAEGWEMAWREVEEQKERIRRELGP